MMRFFTFICLFCLAQLALAQGPRPLRNPDKKNSATFEKVNELLANKELEKAKKLLEKAVKDDSQFIEAFILLGQIYDREKNYSAGIEAYTAAIAIDSDFYAECYFNVAKMQFLQGAYEAAYQSISTYLAQEKRKANLQRDADKILRDAAFAKVAINQPVDFKPLNLGENVNTPMAEYYPTITADDSRLYFTRRLQLPQSKAFQEDFYLSQYDGKEWKPSKPVEGPINTPEYNEGAPSISADGRTMVFTVCELYGDKDYGNNRLGFGSCDLFASFRQGNAWSRPENLGAAINTTEWESQPSLSADGRTLYFVRALRGKARNSSMDIFRATRNENNKWNEAQKLSATINTDLDESSVFIHPDGTSLYFSSQGHPGFGGEDIFVAKLKPQGEWGTPLNLGYPINTLNDENSLLVSAAGNLAYFASDREGGFGDLDLYQFELPANLRPVKVSYTKGIVVDARTKIPLAAAFELIDLESKQVVLSSASDRLSGEFLVTLPSNRAYALNVAKENYLFHSENFSLPESSDALNPKTLNIELEKVEAGKRVVLNNIFFETAKFDLKPASEVELLKLKEFLINNPELKIEIGGHTDNMGDDAYNQSLSENRAKAVYTYLINKGIGEERLSYEGYGKTLPISDNATEQGRASNRRTEFKVL